MGLTVYQLLTVRIESFEDSQRISGIDLSDIVYGMKDARENLTIEAAECECL